MNIWERIKKAFHILRYGYDDDIRFFEHYWVKKVNISKGECFPWICKYEKTYHYVLENKEGKKIFWRNVIPTLKIGDLVCLYCNTPNPIKRKIQKRIRCQCSHCIITRKAIKERYQKNSINKC